MISKDIKIDFSKELFRWGPIPGYLIFLSVFMDVVYVDFIKRFGSRWPDALFLFKKGQTSFMNEDEPLKVVAEEVFKKNVLDRSVYDALYTEWQEDANLLKTYQASLNDKILSGYSEKELLEGWDKLIVLYKKFLTIGMIPEFANYGSLPMLERKLREVIKDENTFADAMEVLTAPEKPSFYQNEEIALSKSDDLEAHYLDYFWLKNSYGGAERLPKDYFEKRKSEIPNDFEALVKLKLKETGQRKAELKERLKLSDEVMNIAQAISGAIEWQDERKGYIFEVIYYEELFLKEISKRYGYDLESLHYARVSEISDILKGVELKDELLRREKQGAGLYCSVPTTLLAQEDFDKFWSEYVNAKAEGEVKELKGSVACKGTGGIVRGIIRIVLDPRKISEMKPGEILVAAMTSPEYVFAMKSASAVITDHGGLTSHAAIVSRELNVLCVIGTKYATQVLTDGDEVEIDPDSGIVRIIK